MAETKKEPNLFQSLWPSMFQHTRLLILDHDVFRFHSLDLFRWQLAQDSKNKDYAHFISVEPSVRIAWLGGKKVERSQLIHTFQGNNDFVNVYENFLGYEVPSFPDGYEEKLHQLFADEKMPIIRTDLFYTMEPVFSRKDMTTYIMHYKNDSNKLDFPSTKIIPVKTMFDVDAITDFIIHNRINAMMLGSIDICISIIDKLLLKGFKSPITCMTGLYKYNYGFNEMLGCPEPKFNRECGLMQLEYEYEFASFDPFTGITGQYILSQQLKEEEEREARTDSEQRAAGRETPPDHGDDAPGNPQ